MAKPKVLDMLRRCGDVIDPWKEVLPKEYHHLINTSKPEVSAAKLIILRINEINYYYFINYA